MSDYTNTHKFKELIEKYNKLPKSEKRQSTFFDIMGNSHHENTCSNILSFYFDTRKEHNLNDLLIKALVKNLEYEDKELFEIDKITVVNIDREKNISKKNDLDNNGRIDILIETESHIICIENKIYHNSDANPFIDYQKYIEKEYSNKKHIFILLHLTNEVKKEKFQLVSYNAFIENIELNIGKYLRNTNDKYLIFLIDFLYSIQKLEGNYSMTNEEIAFFLNNQEKIQPLAKGLLEDLPKEIGKKVEDLLVILEKDNTFFHNIGIWKNCCVYYFFKLKGLDEIFGLDVHFFVERKHWEVTLFIRDEKNISQKAKDKLDELNEKLKSDTLKDNNDKVKIGDNRERYILLREEFLYNINDLAKSVNKILNKLTTKNEAEFPQQLV